MSAFVRVIIDRSIRRELDYSLPEAMAGKVVVGARVRVPFRDKTLLATVVATLEESPAEKILGFPTCYLSTRSRTKQASLVNDGCALLTPERRGDGEITGS